MLPHVVGRLAVDDRLNLCVIRDTSYESMPFCSHVPTRAGRRGVTARLFPAVQRARQQPADRRGPNARRRRRCRGSQLLRAQREQQAIALGKSLQRLARALQTAVFIRKQRRRRRARRAPGGQGTHRPRRRCRSRAACAATVNSQPRRLLVSPPALEMAQELQEGLLHDVLRVLVVPDRTIAKRYTAAPCSSNRSRAACDAWVGVSICRHRYNARGERFVTEAGSGRES